MFNYSNISILKHFNTVIPEYHYDSICHFDYQTELQKAENYRKAEVPFIIYNNPEVDSVVQRWSDIDYISSRLGWFLLILLLLLLLLLLQ